MNFALILLSFFAWRPFAFSEDLEKGKNAEEPSLATTQNSSASTTTPTTSPPAKEPEKPAEPKYYKYRVSKSIPTLGEISRSVYGTTKRWKEIAKWNNLRPPYYVRTGQILRLQEAPKLTMAEGKVELNKMWNQRYGIEVDHSPAAAYAPPETLVKSYHKPVTQNPKAEALFLRGKKLYDEGKFKEAAEFFKESRINNREMISAWIFEIQSWKQVGDSVKEARAKSRFMRLHPSMSEISPLRMPASQKQEEDESSSEVQEP